ncbi:MAG: hypothetical protein ACI9OJ_003514 [Myxococcota bacterium]
MPAVHRATGLVLRSEVPSALIGETSVPVQTSTRVFHITAEGSEKIHETTGDLELEITEPGRYRVEVFVGTEHLLPYLEKAPHLQHEFPWIYSNPFEVQ